MIEEARTSISYEIVVCKEKNDGVEDDIVVMIVEKNMDSESFYRTTNL